MAYNEFAYFYDEFNGEADYDALYAHIHAKLKEHGIHDGKGLSHRARAFIRFAEARAAQSAGGG